MARNRLDLFELIRLIRRWRKPIIVNFIIVSVFAVFFSLVIPESYVSRTTLLPPVDETGQMGAMSSLLGKLPLNGMGLNLGAASEETSLFMAIFSSRTVMESVVDRFDLIKRFKRKNMEAAVKKLRKLVTVKTEDEGTITISVESKTKFLPNRKKRDEARNLSRQMADFLVAEVDRVNKRLKTEKAGNTREFIERRYVQNQEDLANAENAFKTFQRRYGAVAVPEQTSATISAAAELKAKIISKEFELGFLQNYIGDSSSDVQRVKAEMNQLNKKYDEMKFGFQNKGKNGQGDVLFSLYAIPELGLEYARLIREVMVQEKIMEFLLPQLEQAKIQEAKDTPTVQVLDPANWPIRKAKPKRSILVLLFGFGSLLCSVTWAIFRENWQNISDKVMS